MNILILEDEPPIAEHIAWMCRKILKEKLSSCHILHTLDEASDYIKNHSIDLLLLDINLEGDNGYNILKRAVAESFHTIIISAHTNQAVTAFTYGVLDFIPKPFNKERLKKAFERYEKRIQSRELDTRYLAVREHDGIHLIETEKIQYIKAAGNYSEANIREKGKMLIGKSLNKLEQILPTTFKRIHKSYIINIADLNSYVHAGGGTYQVRLQDGTRLPLSRTKYKEFQQLFL